MSLTCSENISHPWTCGLFVQGVYVRVLDKRLDAAQLVEEYALQVLLKVRLKERVPRTWGCMAMLSVLPVLTAVPMRFFQCHHVWSGSYGWAGLKVSRSYCPTVSWIVDAYSFVTIWEVILFKWNIDWFAHLTSPGDIFWFYCLTYICSVLIQLRIHWL